MLKDTTEYSEMDDDDIQRAAMKATLKNASDQMAAKRLQQSEEASTAAASSAKSKLPVRNNDWIPTQAVRAIEEIRKKYGGEMNERCVSAILYQLNDVWRTIMRKENDAIKKRLNAQIMDLRRQIVTKQAFDKGELMKEISRVKKELAFANKQLYNKKVSAEGAGPTAAPAGGKDQYQNELETSMRLVENINN